MSFYFRTYETDLFWLVCITYKVSEYGQEVSQSHTAD